MAGELYRTYEVLIEESVHPNHPKRNTSNKASVWNESIYAALRDTNAVFQDAVCYYTILLAGLAGHATEKGELLNPLWHELCRREQTPNGDVARVLARLAKNYQRLPCVRTLDDFLKGVLTTGRSEPECTRSYKILESQLLNESGDELKIEKLNVFAHDNGLRLCSTTSKRKMPGSAPLDRLYWQLHSKESCYNDVSAMDNEIRNFLELECIKPSDYAKKHYKTAFTTVQKPNSTEVIWAKSRKAKNLLPLIANHLPSIEADINKAKTNDRRLVWLHKTGPIKPMAWLLARFLWLRDDVRLVPGALEDLVDFIKKPYRKIPTSVGGELQSMPSKFPYFTHWLGINFESSAFRGKFDDAALSAAAEDVFKYKIRTLERQDREKRLCNVLNAYEGEGVVKLAQEDSSSGKNMTIRGMKGDPRWKGDKVAGRKGIVDLLNDLACDKGIDDYGLRSGTIGGWDDLRKAFLRLEKKAKDEHRNLTQDELEDIVEEEKRENRQGFGSDDFFKKLCEPQYHHLWCTSMERNDIADFISHYVQYSEWKEKLEKICEKNDRGNLTIKPISYTFPGEKNRHGKISFRHFGFKEKLNRLMKLNLFRQMRSADDAHYELIQANVTLSARRLKRDEIMTAEGTSINALWCPPLVLKEKPRTGKRKKGEWPAGDLNVSFSLMVEDDKFGELPSPVHMTISIPLTAQELDRTLRADKVKWGKSLQWERDGAEFYGKFFRWKLDLLTRAKESLNDLLKEKLPPQHLRKLRNIAGTITSANTSASKLASDVQKIGESVCGDDAVGKKRAKKIKQAVDSIKDCAKSLWHTEKNIDFHILSIDLGTRFSSAFARLRVHCEPNGEGRLISPDEFAVPIRAHMYRKGTLRLPGENAQVWDHKRGQDGKCIIDSAGQYVYEKQDELYGNDGRGRFPDEGIGEIKRFRELADKIVPIKTFSILGWEKMTYPEMGDHLIRRLRRRLRRLRLLFNLRWRVIGKTEWEAGEFHPRGTKDQNKHYRTVVETLGRLASPKTPRMEGEEEDSRNKLLCQKLATEGEWKKVHDELNVCKEPAREEQRCLNLDAAIAQWNWKSLAEELERQLREYFTNDANTADLVVAVVEHCLPLRKRHWRWDSAKHHLYKDKGETDSTHIPYIKGMRGLSIKRLEQVLNLRQLCQSYAKLEKRWALGDAGVEPQPTLREENADDPCPDLLEKSNELRKQRVNQAAHLILTEALGLELKNPAEVKDKKARKSEVDLHGEYKQLLGPKTGRPLPRCSVIALEDLTRYRTSQERPRSENSRLMRWAHRAIVKKLADMAKPFGITIMLVDPSFSSRFDSRTGLPGIRVNSESRGFHEKMPYSGWLKQRGKDGKPSDLANKVTALKALFDKNENYTGQLLIAVDGGKQFLPVPADSAEMGKDYHPPNADENAAINIGLRALAHPDRWDIFPRLRSRELSDNAVQIRNRRGFFATFTDGHANKVLRKNGANQIQTAMTDNDQNDESDEDMQQDFFVNALNFPDLPEEESYRPNPDTQLSFNAYRRGLFLKRVQSLCEKRISAINRLRLK